MTKAKSLLLFIVGLINFAPVIGVISAQKLSSLYGITINDPNLEILLRHRAILFGVIGGYLIYSVFQPRFQKSAMLMGFASMAGFLLLVWQTGQFNDLILKVAYVDLAALVLLLAALVLHLKKH